MVLSWDVATLPAYPENWQGALRHHPDNEVGGGNSLVAQNLGEQCPQGRQGFFAYAEVGPAAALVALDEPGL